jgi:hypothetical protein
MELIPKALVVGVFAAVAPGPPDDDKVNRIWMQLSRRMGYRQLLKTGEGANFIGASPEDAFIIQPPLLQFRSPAAMGLANAADDAQTCLKTAAEHLGATQFANLGIRHVLHAPAPDGEGRAYIQRLVGQHEDALEPLQRGGEIWVGVKYGISSADGSTYTLVIEPFVADPKFLFIDLDAQLPGPADLDRITDRAADAARFITETVSAYLDNPPIP